MFLNKLSLLVKILLVPIISFIGFLLFLFILWRANSQNVEILSAIDERHFPVMQSVQHILTSLESLKKSMEDAVVMGDMDTLEETSQAKEALLLDMEALVKIGPDLTDEVGNLSSSFTTYHDTAKALSEKFIDGTINFETDQDEIAAVSEAYRVLSEQMETFRDHQEARFKESILEAKAMTRNNLWKGLLLGGVLCVALIGTVAMSLILIRKSLRALISSMRDVAQGEGDLTRQLQVESKDELGELTLWFNTFLQKMRTMVGDIATSSGDVSRSSENLSEASTILGQVSDDVSNRSQSMGRSVEELTTNMHQITEHTQEVTQNAKEADLATNQMAVEFSEFVQRVQQARSVVSDANELMVDTQKQVVELESGAEKIGDISETIQAIASQIKLLSLNATIEAARAGEAGKGFGVVAKEVKELSTQTHEATEGITELIENIQRHTFQTVDKINKFSEMVSQIQTINEALEHAIVEQEQAASDISSNVGRVSSGANEIFQSISLSKENTESIKAQILELTQAAERTRDSVTISEQVVGQLKGQASALENFVGEFKH